MIDKFNDKKMLEFMGSIDDKSEAYKIIAEDIK